MVLKDGYKQTEVGPVPVSWEERRLGEIAVIGSGGTPSRDNPGYWNGSIPWITTSQIDFNEISEAVEYITGAGLRNSAAKMLPPGTLLMALYGQGKTRGKVGVLTFEAATNQACASISIAPTVLAEFVRYFLTHRYDAIRSASNGGSQDNLSGQIVKRLPVVLPPPGEQKSITRALSDVDALLSALDRLIAKRRDLKQAAMQQLLIGQTRLPGFTGKWERVSVGEMFTFKNGLNKAKEFFGTGTPIVNYMDVYRHSGIAGASLAGRVSVSPQEQKAFEVRRGDVFFTRTSETVEEVGLASVMLDECRGTVFSGFLLRARPTDDRLTDQFKRYCFRSEAVRRQIVSRASYTTRALTNGRLLSAVVLDQPPRDEQIAIAKVLSDMDSELTALEQRREKTRLLKHGMMQELLTGRTRLV